MGPIVIWGSSENFVPKHLAFWFDLNQIEYIIVDRIEHLLHKEQEYRAVIFAANELIEEGTVEWMNQMFSINVKMLHEALQLNTNLFIYLDRSYDCYSGNNAVFQNLLSINRQMVKSYCDYFEKNYTILFLYNLIGYKFKNYQGEVNALNDVLEHSKRLVFNSEYKYVHFVYIRDVLEVITSLILKDDNMDSRNYNKEEHLRYNNTGFDVEKMISLFEQLSGSNYVFKYKKLTIGNKVAPCYGSPSQLLSHKHINPDHWLRVQRKANYY